MCRQAFISQEILCGRCQAVDELAFISPSTSVHWILGELHVSAARWAPDDVGDESVRMPPETGSRVVQVLPGPHASIEEASQSDACFPKDRTDMDGPLQEPPKASPEIQKRFWCFCHFPPCHPAPLMVGQRNQDRSLRLVHQTKCCWSCSNKPAVNMSTTSCKEARKHHCFHQQGVRNMGI